MKNNDVQLIHRILDGDDTSLRGTCGKISKTGSRACMAKNRRFPQRAEEITQDTFLKAYQELER